MKIHAKKKATRAGWKKLARNGKANNSEGQWVNRGSLPDNSMKRDFWPQSGKS